MAATALAPRPAQPPRVLFVDDEPSLRQLGEAVLQKRGYEVKTAENGIAALEVLRKFMPDLIISDLRMPKMSGFELLSIVRRRFPGMPVIAISGEFITHSEIMGIADHFFSKGGYTLAELCDKVEELVTNPPPAHAPQSPPLWVPVTASGEVVLTCTDCLRSFPVRVCPSQFGNPLRTTTCAVCGSELRYCVDSTSVRGSGDCGLLNQIH